MLGHVTYFKFKLFELTFNPTLAPGGNGCRVFWVFSNTLGKERRTR